MGRRTAFCIPSELRGYPGRDAQQEHFSAPVCAAGTCHLVSLSTIWLCVTLWIRAKTVDQEERGNAERRALFVGLWPPMFWLIGDSVERQSSRYPRHA